MSYGNSGDYDRDNRTGPYAAGPLQPPPAKSNAVWWILGILGVVLGGGALLCCGGAFFAYRVATQAVAEVVKSAVEEDPAIQEHIGTISDLNVNLTATGNSSGGNKMVFDIKGDKGSGQLEILMDNDGENQSVNSGVLVLPNGDKHNVVIRVDEDDEFLDEPMENSEVDFDLTPDENQVEPAIPEPAVN